MADVRPGIGIQIFGNNAGVVAMLDALDSALNPVAVAGFLSGVVDPYFRKRAESRFANEGDDVVGKWRPLKDSTVDIRMQMGFGPGPINSRTGELEEFITGAPNNLNIHPWGASWIFPGSQPQGELFTKFETAQKGKEWPQTVARPVLGMNYQDLNFVLLALATHIETAGSKRFGG